jgi:hypothetical protein
MTSIEWLFEKLNVLDKHSDIPVSVSGTPQEWNNLFEQAKEMHKQEQENLYTKEDVLKAGEIGEINHFDYKHIVSLLDEAKAINKSLKQPKKD